MERYIFIHNAPLVNNTLPPDLATAVSEGNAFIVREDGTKVNLVTADTDIASPLGPNDGFRIVQAPLATGEVPRTTPTIKAKDVVSVKLDSYSAGTKQVTTIDEANLPTSGSYFIKIVRVDEGYEKFPVKTYEIQAGANAQANTDAIVAAINADPKSIVVAADANPNVTLTAKELGYSFRTMLYKADGTTINAITQTTAPTPGIGTPAHVAGLEEASRGHFGGLYQVGIVKNPSMAQIGSQTFDLLRIVVKNTGTSENMLKPIDTSEIVIAYRSGLLTNTANLGATAESRLKTFFGLS